MFDASSQIRASYSGQRAQNLISSINSISGTTKSIASRLRSVLGQIEAEIAKIKAKIQALEAKYSALSSELAEALRWEEQQRREAEREAR